MSHSIIRKLHESGSLEDEIVYVLRKAARGCGIAAEDMPSRANITAEEWQQCLSGNGAAHALERCAATLRLHPSALKNLSTYKPTAPVVHGVLRFDMPFEGDRVNAWLIRDEDVSLLFDAGNEPDSASRLLVDCACGSVDFFLTHHHRDHVGGIDALQVRMKKQWHIPYGQSQSFGTLSVTAIDLSGHCTPSTGYIIRGLSRPLCVVGDALFAGSIGGCADPFSYQTAIRLLQQHVLSLPPETILLPGHGPATTVAQELRSNPFLAT